MEELNGKLLSKTEELMDRQTKWMEVTESLRKKEDELKKQETKSVTSAEGLEGLPHPLQLCTY